MAPGYERVLEHKKRIPYHRYYANAIGDIQGDSFGDNLPQCGMVVKREKLKPTQPELADAALKVAGRTLTSGSSV